MKPEKSNSACGTNRQTPLPKATPYKSRTLQYPPSKAKGNCASEKPEQSAYYRAELQERNSNLNPSSKTEFAHRLSIVELDAFHSKNSQSPCSVLLQLITAAILTTRQVFALFMNFFGFVIPHFTQSGILLRGLGK